LPALGTAPRWRTSSASVAELRRLPRQLLRGGIIWVNHHSLFKNFAKVDRDAVVLEPAPALVRGDDPVRHLDASKYLTDNSRSASLRRCSTAASSLP